MSVVVPMQQQNQGTLYDFISQKEYSKDECRFMMDLEFVQDLSNAFYLKYLADNKYFDDPAFLAYLKYLLYWKKPEYSRYIMYTMDEVLSASYPQCLYFLDKLQDEAFRYLLCDQNHINFLDLESHLALRKHNEDPRTSDSTVN